MNRETIQTILDLLNPLHGEIDRQTYNQRVQENFDAPADAEYNVDITARMERDLSQAVVILEGRLRESPKQEPVAWRIAWLPGSPNSTGRPGITDSKEIADARFLQGAFVTPLYEHPPSIESVTVQPRPARGNTSDAWRGER